MSDWHALYIFNNLSLPNPFAIISKEGVPIIKMTWHLKTFLRKSLDSVKSCIILAKVVICSKGYELKLSLAAEMIEI